jgi:CheY-like chemotaxis protein
MGAKRALIVDDSRSARLFLSRILEKYEIDVEMAENAEAAIEYLGSHRPDVIFMDHMMPGMDGFQAVQAIKNNPRTATIPIMMYTSQEGELYLGQARALGAVGVLPKQIKPTDVSKVLYQLHLVADRRTTEQTTFRPVNLSVEESTEEERAASAAKPLTEAALRDQFAELRRVLVASIDTQSERITADVRALLHDALPPGGYGGFQDTPPPQRNQWAWVIASLALIVALASTGLWWREANLRQQLVVQLGEVQKAAARPAAAPAPAPAAAPIQQAVDEAAATANAIGLTPVAPATVEPVQPESETGGDALRANTAASDIKPIIAAVPYGDDALDGPRLEIIRQLLSRLAGQQYSGVVDVRTFTGRFCLVGNATEGYSVAPEESPFARCDVVGNPHEESLQPAQRESLAFANLASEYRAATKGAMRIQVSQGDVANTLVPYPQVSGGLTAGEWNRAAGANNRIEVRVR